MGTDRDGRPPEIDYMAAFLQSILPSALIGTIYQPLRSGRI